MSASLRFSPIILVEKLGGFGGGEAQVGGAQFGQLAAGARRASGKAGLHGWR